MEDTLLYPRELIAERVVFTPADHAQIALCRGDHNRLGLAYQMAFLLAAAPGGAGTQHLVNADVLAALGPHGYLVNVGRGTVVDTQALIDALRAQRIAGAGLDVLEEEPSVPPLLPELLQCDNVVVTPHVAGRAPESRTAATALILANLNAHFAGKPLPSPVSITDLREETAIRRHCLYLV